MKKIVLMCSLALCSVGAMAHTTSNQDSRVVGVHEDGYTTFISPRTGVSYSLDNPNQAEIIFKPSEISAVTAENVQRIVATNPALSPESQEQARQKLAQGIVAQP